MNPGDYVCLLCILEGREAAYSDDPEDLMDHITAEHKLVVSTASLADSQKTSDLAHGDGSAATHAER